MVRYLPQTKTSGVFPTPPRAQEPSPGLRRLLRRDPQEQEAHKGGGKGVMDMSVRPEIEFTARFENWRRWCNQKGLYQGRTGSIEGAYRSPQHWDPPEPRPAEINVPDAVLVNRAYTRLALLAPKQASIIKVLVFRPYWRPQWQGQKLGIHWRLLDEALERAKKMLRNQLEIC